MTNTKYQTSRVAGRNLMVGTVCYHGGEIVALGHLVEGGGWLGRVVTFRDGREQFVAASERIRIYPNL